MNDKDSGENPSSCGSVPRYYALVPAAGSGTRSGAEMPKQYLPLGGAPLLFQTLLSLCAAPQIECVWVVLAPDDDYWKEHDAHWEKLAPKLKPVYCGGATRAQSVRNGLEAVAESGMPVRDEDWMLVHDAARPCLDSRTLERLLKTVGDDPVGGLLAVPLADTLKRGSKAVPGKTPRVEATLPREHLWQAQTPQMFRFGLLRAALERAPEVSDEAGAVETCGHAPLLVTGSPSNLKVTWPGDMELAERLLLRHLRML